MRRKGKRENREEGGDSRGREADRLTPVSTHSWGGVGYDFDDEDEAEGSGKGREGGGAGTEDDSKSRSLLAGLSSRFRVCPGCGVRMQSVDPKAPGFFVLPARLLQQIEGEEVEVEGEGEDDGGWMEEEEEDSEGKKAEREGWLEFDLGKGEGGKPLSYDMLKEADEEDEDEDLGFAEFDDFSDEVNGKNGDDADWMDDVMQSAPWRDQPGGGAQSPRADGDSAVSQGGSEEAAEPLVVCARCHSLRNYGQVKDSSAESLLPDFDFDRVVGLRLRVAYGRRAVVLMVVDAVDFDGSFPRRAAQLLRAAEEEVAGKWKEGEAGNAFRLVLVVNKMDLLPRQVGEGERDKGFAQSWEAKQKDALCKLYRPAGSWYSQLSCLASCLHDSGCP